MSKFHISPKTNRAGICRAKEGGCPFGENTPHFKTKDEAKAYIAGRAAAENEMFTTTRKTSSGFVRDKDLDQKAAEIISEVVDQKAARGWLKNSLNGNLSSFGGVDAESYYPGCDGCTGFCDDFCRCETLTGNAIIKPEAAAGHILYFIAKDEYKPKWGARRKKDREPSAENTKRWDEAVKALAKVLEGSEFVESDSWTVVGQHGYYGEEVSSITFDGDIDQINKRFESYAFWSPEDS